MDGMWRSLAGAGLKDPNPYTESRLLVEEKMGAMDFLQEHGEASRFKIEEVIGKGSYGVVCAAIDTQTGAKVAIKRINDIFEHVSDATRILREIKLLRLVNHPDIVKVKHIMLPPSPREFKDIYVVFELMESDLHEVIKANNDLTPEHYQFFLYQLLRGLKYLHSAKVFHRDLKPKNILANSDCKLKICDFGLARVDFDDAPTTVFWTDYVATRWYRAPELCGSFYSKYTQAVDIWSIGCIFAEILTGKPLFPGKNVVDQLDLMTDMLGTPSAEFIANVRNERVRSYLSSMSKKLPTLFCDKFPNADPLAISVLEKMLSFDPKNRPSAEEALADPYFKGLAKVEREPSSEPIARSEFEFERRHLSKDEIRGLIYREILEYHPQMLKEFLNGTDSGKLVHARDVEQFKMQFMYAEGHAGENGYSAPLCRKHASSPRPSLLYSEAVIIPSSVRMFGASSHDREFELPVASRKYTEAEEDWQVIQSYKLTPKVLHRSPHIVRNCNPNKAGFSHSYSRRGAVTTCKSATFSRSQLPAPVYS